jgi:hypothetical protein
LAADADALNAVEVWVEYLMKTSWRFALMAVS